LGQKGLLLLYCIDKMAWINCMSYRHLHVVP
jgi:hypothetical protein